METKHTPGPWIKSHRNNNDMMMTFHGVNIGGVYVDITTANEAADAHLISTAPELLEALQAVVRVADRSTVEFDLARAAIAKATGRTG